MDDFAALRQRLVDNQIRPSEVTNPALIKAFLTTERENFLEPTEQPFAYSDRELPMAAGSPGRLMIDPVQLARLLQMLPQGQQKRVLVIGGGSGYSAALLSQLVGEVVLVEEDAALAQAAAANLARLRMGNVEVICAPLHDGCPAKAPFDGILIDGAIEFMPDALVAQLTPEGVIATIERDSRISRAMLYERVNDTASRRSQFEGWAPLLPGFERPHEFVF